MDPNDYLTTGQAAEALHLSPQRIWQLCLGRRLAGATKLGRDWLIPRAAVAAYAQIDRRPGRRFAGGG